jgi:hypothetical protein
MYTNNKTQETMGPTLKPFEVLENVTSFETLPRTQGQLIYTILTREICFFSGSLDLQCCTQGRLCVSLCHNCRGSEALYLVSLLCLLFPDDLLLGMCASSTRFSIRACRYLIWTLVPLPSVLSGCSMNSQCTLPGTSFSTTSEISEWKHTWYTNDHCDLHHQYALQS